MVAVDLTSIGTTATTIDLVLPKFSGFSTKKLMKYGTFFNPVHINGLVQDCSNSIANALELLQSCTKPSICSRVKQLNKISITVWQCKCVWQLLHIKMLCITIKRTNSHVFISDIQIPNYFAEHPICNKNTYVYITVHKSISYISKHWLISSYCEDKNTLFSQCNVISYSHKS